jgi:hypothetical protein
MNYRVVPIECTRGPSSNASALRGNHDEADPAGFRRTGEMPLPLYSASESVRNIGENAALILHSDDGTLSWLQAADSIAVKPVAIRNIAA